MTFLQALINGLALAAVYALLGLGFVIVYKSMKVLSFAQPALMVWGAWWVVYFASERRFNFYVSVLIAVGVAAVTGLVIERVFLRPMVGKSIFAVAIMTIGIDLVVRTSAGHLYGLGLRSTSAPWAYKTLKLGTLTLNYGRLAAIVVAVVLVMALLAFFRFSRMGLAMRAAAFDQEVALVQGVSVAGVFAVSWALAAVLAAMAGLFMSPVDGSVSDAMFPLALRALPVVVIGGLDSIGGTLVAALLVGLAESLTNSYQLTYAAFLGKNLSQVIAYVVMFVVLLVRPYGFFGTKEVERV